VPSQFTSIKGAKILSFACLIAETLIIGFITSTC